MYETRFSLFMRQLRLSKDMSRQQFADFLKVDALTVLNWECGITVPRIGTLHHIAVVFDIPLYDLLDMTVKRKDT